MVVASVEQHFADPRFSMSSPTSARHQLFFRDTSYTPSAPIPIPHIRRVTDPPPRSPTRIDSSPDLIFEMSPHVSNETPLARNRGAFAPSNSDACLAPKPALPFASRLACTKSPCANLPPYWEEPFLYSIPRLPVRPPFHARTRSAVVNGSRYSAHHSCMKERLTDAFPSPSAKSLSPVEAPSASCSDTCISDHESDGLLTTAFQQSLMSTSSLCSSGSFDRVEHPISPPASLVREGVIGHPIRMPLAQKKRKSSITITIPPVIRTSAAEPVLSFAQAEPLHSQSSGVIACAVRTPRNSIRSPRRVRSPFPAARIRRNSALRTRGSKVSDEDIAVTLEQTDSRGRFGLEKFLPAALQHRGATDENKFIEELPERGRTRSRTRAGRRM